MAGPTDLVIDPTNLWLTIHESIGMPSSTTGRLATKPLMPERHSPPGQARRMRYGSPVMNVTADRTVEHGLATIGYDAEGVAAQQWDLVRDGIFVGYQLDRGLRTQAGIGPLQWLLVPTPPTTCRSNGCPMCLCSRAGRT